MFSEDFLQKFVGNETVEPKKAHEKTLCKLVNPWVKVSGDMKSTGFNIYLH